MMLQQYNKVTPNHNVTPYNNVTPSGLGVDGQQSVAILGSKNVLACWVRSSGWRRWVFRINLIGLLLLLQSICAVEAQVVFTPQLPPGGISLKSELWSFAVSHTGATPIAVKITMVMTDQSNGQQVLAASTGSFTLYPGAKLYRYNDLLPITYTVVNTLYPVDPAPNGFLPIGNFMVCYEVLKTGITNELPEAIADECTSLEVLPLSPPYLNFPEDRLETDDRRPLFGWTPPAPVSLFLNLSYDFSLVEVLPQQTPESAMEQNLPLIMQMNLSEASYQYPLSQAGLDTGRVYAWRITAKNNGLLVARSEVWSFKVVQNMDNTQHGGNPSRAYFPLQQTPTTAYFLSMGGVLKFAYNNEMNDSVVTIHVYDISGKDRRPVGLPRNTIGLKYGENFIDFDLGENVPLVNNRLYVVEIVNSKQQVWMGRFRYRRS